MGLYYSPQDPCTEQILPYMAEQSLPKSTISRSIAFSSKLTYDPHFWTICTPVSATSENLLPSVAKQALVASFVWPHWAEGC